MFRPLLSSALRRLTATSRPAREVLPVLHQSTTSAVSASSPTAPAAAAAGSPPGRRRPCGKCLRCSCHTASSPSSSSSISRAPSRQQSTAVQQREAQTLPSPPRFEPWDKNRPAWIKDPTSPSGLSVASVEANNEAQKNWLEVSWEDGTKSEYPYLWLRDNCACPDCFHPITLSRRFLMKNLDVNIKPTSVTVDPEDRKIHIEWTDGHLASYPWSWLEGRSFSGKTAAQRQKWLPRPHTYWGGEMQDNMPTDTFHNIMSDDNALYKWINTMEQTGLFKVTDAPTEEGQLVKLAERVAFLKNTHFGELWEVRTRMSPSNLQYTTATLGLHIDLTYYDYTPGVQMLHCIRQARSDGGDNQFADGFHIAERMRTEYPEYYKLLTEIIMDHYDLGEEKNQRKFFKLQRQPVIRHDRDGRYDRITYNNMVRDNVLLAPVEVVNELYKAMKTFDDMLHDPKSHIVYKMSPGDIICFHNYRVLHGRSGYVQLEAGDRFLQGGFLDWDEMYCRRRVLQMELGIEE